MFFGSNADALLPVSVYLVALLAALCLMAFVRRGTSTRRRLLLLAACVWAWTLSVPALGNLWIRHMEGPVQAVAPHPARPGPALILVLASGEISNRGGPLAARLDGNGYARLAAAVSLWRQTGGRLMMAGGLDTPGPDGQPSGSSVAHVMARHAKEWGVPDDAVVVVSGSTRTYEDLVNAAPAVRAHAGPVWLVTSALHMPRALAVTDRLGLQVLPYRCDYRQFSRMNWVAWLPNAGGPAMFASALHEAVGLWYYRARGWA